MYEFILVLLLISGVIISMLSVFAYSRRARGLVQYFAWSMLCAAVWNFGFALEILSPSLEGKLFWANVQFLGISFLPTAWLMMSLAASGRSRGTRNLLLAICVVPFLTNILAWTNPLHNLFRIDPGLVTGGVPFPVLDSDYGLYFYSVHAPFGYLLFVISLIILLRNLGKSTGVYRRQIVALLFSVLLPLGVDLLYVLGVTPIPDFNFSSITFTISGLILGMSILRNKFLDLLPLAYDAAVNGMNAGVIVVDPDEYVIDLNPAAERMTGALRGELIGRELREGLPELIPTASGGDGRSEVRITRDGREQILEVQQAEILSRREHSIGRVFTLHDVTERVELLNEVGRLSFTDPLTDAMNRRALSVQGEQEIQRAYRYHHNLSLILLDVDNFKEINDLYGHQYGDEILKEIVRSIYRSTRTTDQVFRYGGDEFIILLIETEPVHAVETAERIRSGLLTLPLEEAEGGPEAIQVSIGVTGLQSNDTPETMLQRADKALYRAKAEGKDRVVLL